MSKRLWIISRDLRAATKYTDFFVLGFLPGRWYVRSQFMNQRFSEPFPAYVLQAEFRPYWRKDTKLVVIRYFSDKGAFVSLDWQLQSESWRYLYPAYAQASPFLKFSTDRRFPKVFWIECWCDECQKSVQVKFWPDRPEHERPSELGFKLPGIVSVFDLARIVESCQ